MSIKKKTEEEIEREVSRRHVAIAERRKKELEENPLRDLPSLTQQIQDMRTHLESIPDDKAWSIQDSDAMDECRSECFSLIREIESIMEMITGN